MPGDRGNAVPDLVCHDCGMIVAHNQALRMHLDVCERSYPPGVQDDAAKIRELSSKVDEMELDTIRADLLRLEEELRG